MALPPTVEVYRWEDGRSIHRVLTGAGLPRDLLERQRQGPVEDTTLKLNVQETPTYTLMKPATYALLGIRIVDQDPKTVGSGLPRAIHQVFNNEPFYFDGGGVAARLGMRSNLKPHVLGLQIAQFPGGLGYMTAAWKTEKLRASILPFVLDMMRAPGLSVSSWDRVFGPGPEYLDDRVYDRLGQFYSKRHGKLTLDDLEMIFENVEGTKVWQTARIAGVTHAQPHFTVPFEGRTLRGDHYDVGWSLFWNPGGRLTYANHNLLVSLKEADKADGWPRLLRASKRPETERERADLPRGTPTFNPSSLDTYRVLNLPSPLLWPPDEFYAWLQGETKS